MRKRTPVCLPAVLLFTIGCAHSYRYLSGEKAEVTSRTLLALPAALSRAGMLPVQNPEQESHLRELERLALDPPVGTPLRALTEKTWEQLSGDDYRFHQGQRQEDILTQAGFPVARYRENLPLNKPYEEAWEYPFCIMYFTGGRLKELVFKPVENPVFYQGAPIVENPHENTSQP